MQELKYKSKHLNHAFVEHVIHEKKKQTPTHITFDGHTWIKNTAVKLTPIVTSPLFLLYWYLSRRSQFQLEFTLSGISGYMYLHSAYS